MCLAVPAVVRDKNEFGLATVDIMGVSRQISLDLVPDAEPGDHVLVHAGFAIEKVSEEFAQESLDLIKQMPFLVDELGIPEEQIAAIELGGDAAANEDDA